MRQTNADKTLLVLSQVYVPDPASVGQHMADAAAEMARRGFRVVVLTANRGYDDPSQKYPSRQVLAGVQVRRLPLSSLGKKSLLWRLLGALFFLVQCIVLGLFTRRLRCILVSTSPPMCSLAALVIAAIRRVPIKYWVMDLNPDQAVALGRVKPGSLAVRAFDLLNWLILRHARDVIVLDRFMAQRIEVKFPAADRLTILPPWPHEDHLAQVPRAANPFRARHGLGGKLVFMYSGNHSPASPMTTILQAALGMRQDPNHMFVFVGGGLGKKEVEDTIREHRPPNILSLPYQPLSELAYSLSAADVHIVALGNDMVGIIHPCKVYGAMAVGRPILLLGPACCHVSDILQQTDIGWHIAHGAVEDALTTLREILRAPAAQLDGMGRRATEAVRTKFSKPVLCGRFCDVLERGVTPARPFALRQSAQELFAPRERRAA